VPYIVLRGHWCNIVQNVQAPSWGEKWWFKYSFYEELEQGCDHFPKLLSIAVWPFQFGLGFHSPKHHGKILLGDFNAKVVREYIFKLSIGRESLLNFATSKNLVKSVMFSHRNIHKCTCTSPDGKPHNQICHILINRWWLLSILGVRCFRLADCDTDHYLVVANLGRDWR